MIPRKRKASSKTSEIGTRANVVTPKFSFGKFSSSIRELLRGDEDDMVIDREELPKSRLSHPEGLSLGRVAGDDDQLDRLDRKLRVMRVADRLDVVVGVQPDPVIDVLMADRVIMPVYSPLCGLVAEVADLPHHPLRRIKGVHELDALIRHDIALVE